MNTTLANALDSQLLITPASQPRQAGPAKQDVTPARRDTQTQGTEPASDARKNGAPADQQRRVADTNRPADANRKRTQAGKPDKQAPKKTSKSGAKLNLAVEIETTAQKAEAPKSFAALVADKIADGETTKQVATVEPVEAVTEVVVLAIQAPVVNAAAPVKVIHPQTPAVAPATVKAAPQTPAVAPAAVETAPAVPAPRVTAATPAAANPNPINTVASEAPQPQPQPQPQPDVVAPTVEPLVAPAGIPVAPTPAPVKHAGAPAAAPVADEASIITGAPAPRVAPAAQAGPNQGKAARQGQFRTFLNARPDAGGQEASIRIDTPTAVSQVVQAQPPPVDGQAQVSTSAPPAQRPQGDTMVAQVADQVRASADRLNTQIEIHLRPPELGTVRLTLQADGKDIRGVLKVENPETAIQLQIEAPSLFRRLADSGIQMRRLDISLDNNAVTNRGDSPMANAQAQADQDGSGGAGASGDEPTAPANTYTDDTTPARAATYVTDQTINVWI